jgi:type IV pilus assembly protein PilB
LRKTSTTESKVITIEDPIEYHLGGITQTQVKEGYDFAEGLKSALRQDPDIIMVGEIRDSETARTAIQAALTGHLVFSTLHTNNAAGTIPRLIDLGVEPKIIGSALILALAQRLVRILCPTCKKSRALTEEEIKIAETIIQSAPETLRGDIGSPNGVMVYEPVGCPECGESGFKGRTGVFEGIKMSAEVEAATVTNPGERDVRKASRIQNLLTMREHGLSKVLAGITSFSELTRVVDLGEE